MEPLTEPEFRQLCKTAEASGDRYAVLLDQLHQRGLIAVPPPAVVDHYGHGAAIVAALNRLIGKSVTQVMLYEYAVEIHVEGGAILKIAGHTYGEGSIGLEVREPVRAEIQTKEQQR